MSDEGGLRLAFGRARRRVGRRIGLESGDQVVSLGRDDFGRDEVTGSQVGAADLGDAVDVRRIGIGAGEPVAATLG